MEHWWWGWGSEDVLGVSRKFGKPDSATAWDKTQGVGSADRQVAIHSDELLTIDLGDRAGVVNGLDLLEEGRRKAALYVWGTGWVTRGWGTAGHLIPPHRAGPGRSLWE